MAKATTVAMSMRGGGFTKSCFWTVSGSTLNMRTFCWSGGSGSISSQIEGVAEPRRKLHEDEAAGREGCW